MIIISITSIYIWFWLCFLMYIPMLIAWYYIVFKVNKLYLIMVYDHIGILVWNIIVIVLLYLFVLFVISGKYWFRLRKQPMWAYICQFMFVLSEMKDWRVCHTTGIEFSKKKFNQSLSSQLDSSLPLRVCYMLVLVN